MSRGCCPQSFLEQITVCTGPLQSQRFRIWRVDEYPVGLNVAVTRWLPWARERVVMVLPRKIGASSQELDHRLQFRKVLASCSHQLHISGELRGLRDGFHSSQLSNIASSVSNVSIF